MYRSVRTACLACQQSGAQTAGFVGRQLVDPIVREGRIGFLIVLRQCDPGLHAVYPIALAARAFQALRVRDAASSRHPVDLARPNGLLGADTVAMHDLTFEQVSYR